jgi:hypothetical protein
MIGAHWFTDIAVGSDRRADWRALGIDDPAERQIDRLFRSLLTRQNIGQIMSPAAAKVINYKGSFSVPFLFSLFST